MLYTAYCVAGVGAAFVYSCSIGSALKWFKERRGLAAGIMAAGFGGGTALFIPLIAWLIETRGYQAAFLATGLLQGVVIVVVAQFLRHPPRSPAAAQPVTTVHSAQIGRRQFTTLEMLRTPQFYWMYLAFTLMSTGGLLVTANAGSMASSWGLSLGVLTLAATLSPIANGGARVFWGWASDRLGRETTMVLTFTLQAVCLAAVVMLGQFSGVLFVVTLVAVYFTWGQIYSLFPSLSGDYFGTHHATSNYAVLYTAKGVASIIGPWAGALIFEQTGSWAMGFYGSAAMALVAAAAALRLRAVSRARARLAGASATA
jgi:OFA family oxalate/formate antiporter-like MFS transporter